MRTKPCCRHYRRRANKKKSKDMCEPSQQQQQRISIVNYNLYDIFHLLWHEKFKKPVDALALFCHWCMIENRFKTVIDSKASYRLPNDWNDKPDSYKLMYRKHGLMFELNLDISQNDTLLFQLKRLSDSTDSTTFITISNFLNADNFKSDKFYNALKCLDVLYYKIKNTTKYFKTAAKLIANENEKISTESIVVKIKKENEQRTEAPTENVADNDVDMIDNNPDDEPTSTEKIASDSQHIPILPFISSLSEEILTSSSALANHDALEPHTDQETKPETAAPNGKKKSGKTVTGSVPAAKRKPAEVFDYNPIVNYFYYNRGTENKTLDERLMEFDDFTKDTYYKYKLRVAKVNMIDCFKTGVFKGYDKTSMPIKLTPEIRTQLNLTGRPSRKSAQKSYNNENKAPKTLGKNKFSKKSKPLIKRTKKKIGSFKVVIKNEPLELEEPVAVGNEMLGQVEEKETSDNPESERKRAEKRKRTSSNISLFSESECILAEEIPAPICDTSSSTQAAKHARTLLNTIGRDQSTLDSFFNLVKTEKQEVVVEKTSLSQQQQQTTPKKLKEDKENQQENERRSSTRKKKCMTLREMFIKDMFQPKLNKSTNLENENL